MPRVSVVIPNYNYGRFLASRLRSVLEQTYRDIEVIYLDDGSTDDSEQVLAGFLGDPRVRVVRNEVNSGNAFRQINKGARLASGEYLWVAQADDWAEKDFLETLVAVLDRNPSVGLAYSQSLEIDEHDKELSSLAARTRVLDAERWDHDHVNDGRDECRSYLLFKNTIPNISAVLFRREILVRAGYADETLTLSPDWLTYVNVLLISDVAFVARTLNRFRRHGGSIRQRSERQGLQIQEGYRVLAHIRDRLELSDEEMEAAWDRIAASCLKKTLRLRNRLPLRAALKILRAAKEIDPKVQARLARQAVLGWTRRPIAPQRHWAERDRRAPTSSR